MNKRQWWILALGLAATVALLVLGTVRLTPPAPGPLVETAPGQYEQEVTDAVFLVPKWVWLSVLGLLGLTGVALYGGRSQGAGE